MDLECVQPLQGTAQDHQAIHNGEIYNHCELRQGQLRDFPFRTHCDSEAIIALYEKLRGTENFERELCLTLDGVFAFAIIHGDEFMAARDPIGVKQMYWGTDKDGRKLFRLNE